MTTSCTPKILRLLALAGLALMAPLAWAASFDIPVQPAPAALKLFIKQSGVQVVYLHDELKNVTTKAVKGEFTPEVALSQLLDGSGFVIEPTGNGNYTVTKPAAPKPGSVQGSIRDESGKPVAGAKVAIANSDKAVATDKRGRFLISDVAAGTYVLQVTAEGLQNARVTDVTVNAGRELSMSPITIPVRKQGTLELETYSVSAKKNDGTLELDPYAVSGQRTKAFSAANIDITRTQDDVLPFNVYTSVEIERSGASDLADFFRNRLSQNYNVVIPEEQIQNGTISSASAGAANRLNFANGAGGIGPLGASEMVILVNGRRLPNRFPMNFPEGNVIAGNFRAIPIASIERIEVLSSAASAIYGEGATGGVINIITKQNYRGGTVSVSYETPMDTDAPKRSFDFSYSIPLKWGFGLRLGYGYRDSKPLTVGDRADVTISRWRRLVMQREPGRINNNTGGPPLGATPNILLLDTNFNIVGITSVPKGYAGGGGAGAFQLGSYNLDLAEAGNDGSYGKGSYFGPETKEENIFIALDKDIGKRSKLSVEYRNSESLLKGKVPNSFYLTGYFVEVQPTDSINPFGQRAWVNIFDPRFDRPENKNENLDKSEQLVASLRTTLSDWVMLSDVAYIRDTSLGEFHEFFRPLNTNLFLALQSGAYNPFVDPFAVAPAAPSFYEEYDQSRQRDGSTTANYQASLKASGPLLSLPAGPIALTAGLEWLRQDRGDVLSEFIVVNSKTGASRPRSRRLIDPTTEFKFDTYSAYAELLAPLIPERRRLPFLRRAEIFVSGRSSLQIRNGSVQIGSANQVEGNLTTTTVSVRESTVTTSPWLYAAGAKLTPVEGVSIRFSRSLGFKPPLFSQTVSNIESTSNESVIDRRLNKTISLTPLMRSSGGNPDLEPESTVSDNVGIIIEPAQIPGFRLSVDYVAGTRDNAIEGLSSQTVLNLEVTDPRIAERVTRNAAGEVTFVDSRAINFREIVSKVATVTMQYRRPNILGGEVQLRADLTKIVSYKVQTSAGTIPVEWVRNTSVGSFPIRWNGSAQVTWQNPVWSLGWSTRYFDDVLVRSSDYVAQGSDRMPDAFEHDAFIQWRHPESKVSRYAFVNAMLRDTSLTVGVRNVFNRAPRFHAANEVSGINQADSVYGRSIWVQLRKNF